MKVIEGGPACGYCKGGGRTVCSLDAIGAPCPFCHGTGLQPVEDWSDKVKAEWLRDNKPPVWPNPDCSPSIIKYFGIEFRAPRWCAGYYEDIWPEGWYLKIIGKDKDFSAALTAAVITVAKEAE